MGWKIKIEINYFTEYLTSNSAVAFLHWSQPRCDPIEIGATEAACWKIQPEPPEVQMEHSSRLMRVDHS